MNKTSFFIDDKAIFGGHPTQKFVEELEDLGVRYFVDLTHQDESNIKPYTTKYHRIQYPIRDLGVPTDFVTFTRFIYQICEAIRSLNEGEKIYLHCKGGHGRSGIVVACIVHEMIFKDVEKALVHTSLCHSNRIEMREKWRIIGSPQTEDQRQFVRTICRTVKVDILYTNKQLMDTYLRVLPQPELMEIRKNLYL
jgi:protein tyrosine phosphatase